MLNAGRAWFRRAVAALLLAALALSLAPTAGHAAGDAADAADALAPSRSLVERTRPAPAQVQAQVQAVELGDPEHRKILEARPDGTYDLTLTVQGDSRSSQDIMRANVVVVLDISASMNGSAGSGAGTRINVAKQCIRQLGDTLLSQNDGQGEALVEMSLVTFGTRADGGSGWYADAGSFSSMVNGVTAYPYNGNSVAGGTNWEDALQSAKSTADAKHADNSNPTYIIFVSDGLPTFRNTQGAGWSDYNRRAYQQYGVWGTGSDSDSTTVSRCYEMAKDDARAIVAAGHEFYGISVFQQVDRVESLVDYAYTGIDGVADPTGTAHSHHASNQAELNQALSEIAHYIVRHFHYSDVVIHDALDLQNVGFAADGPVPYVLKKELADGTVIAYDSATGATTGGAWDFGTPTFGADGTVDWRPEAGQGAFLDDAKYSITFPIAPTQQACDAVVDAPHLLVPGDNDGDGTEESTGLRSNVAAEAYVSYCLATVTENGGSATVDREGPYTAEYNKPVVAPEPARLTIVKHWEGDAEGHASTLRPATLHGTVTRDGGAARSVELVPAGPHTYSAAIDVPAGPEGHVYAFAEEQLPPYYELSAVAAQASPPSEAHPDGSVYLKGVAGQVATIEVTNVFRAFPLMVEKVEAGTGTALAGAQFALYLDDGDGAFDAASDQLATVFSDAACTQPVDGSALFTAESGSATFHGLLPGCAYWLRETRAPAGYSLDGAAHAIVVSAGGAMHTLDSAGIPAELPSSGGVSSIVIADEPLPDLPVTAGKGVGPLTAAGACLAAAGLVLAGAVSARRRAG